MQAMERLSSASTESDYVPGMVPFQWEIAPGIPAVQKVIDAPSLPLPPGKRPKDGFYLPFSRTAQSSHLHDEAVGMNSSRRERRSFNLTFPGSSKKPRKIGRNTGYVEDTHGVDGIFSPVSGHRFGSSITRRILMEFQKRRSCLRSCLSHGRKSSSSHNHHHTGRRLDSVSDSNEDEIREPYPTSTYSACSESLLSSLFSHGHGPGHSSLAGAMQQLQVPGSSQFMASMLMSLCPAESDESDEVEAPDAEDEITDDHGGSFSFEPHLTIPWVRVSSPDAFFQAPQQEIMVDPASTTATFHEDRTRAWVDMSSTDMSKGNMSERLHKEPPIARPMANLHCENCGNTILLQPGFSAGTGGCTNKSDRRLAFPVHKSNVADAHSVSNTEASPGRELVRPRSMRESGNPSFAWTSHNQVGAKQDPLVVFVEANVQEPLPRSSCGDPDFSFITNSSVIRLRSTLSNAAPTAEPSLLRRHSFEEQLEPNQPPASRPNSVLPSTLLQNQLTLSPLWPNSVASNSNVDDESDNDWDISSGESSEHGVMRKVADWESKAGLGSSSKSALVYLSRRSAASTTITS